MAGVAAPVRHLLLVRPGARGAGSARLPKSIKLGYATFFDHIHTAELLRARSNQLFAWVEKGMLKVKVGRTYQLSDAARAHADMESRATTGKLLLIPR